MNLISKEETINVLAARAEEVGGIGKAYYERAMQIVAAMPLAEAKQEVKETKPEWTLANKNPNRKGVYLCCCAVEKDEWIEVFRYVGKGEWVDYDGYARTGEVAYWMQLPEKP